MTEEFCLSDKSTTGEDDAGYGCYEELDVKEFIKRLKEEIQLRPLILSCEDADWVVSKIDKLAGGKLT